jgi:hypothetical protein
MQNTPIFSQIPPFYRLRVAREMGDRFRCVHFFGRFKFREQLYVLNGIPDLTLGSIMLPSPHESARETFRCSCAGRSARR